MIDVRELSRHTPVCGIIRRILEQYKEPISCDELTVHVLEAWQRSFPPNPYEDPCLIYKLAGSFPDVELDYTELGGEAPIIEEDNRDPVLVTPQLSHEDINKALDQVKRVRFSLKRPE